MNDYDSDMIRYDSYIKISMDFIDYIFFVPRKRLDNFEFNIT